MGGQDRRVSCSILRRGAAGSESIRLVCPRYGQYDRCERGVRIKLRRQRSGQTVVDVRRSEGDVDATAARPDVTSGGKGAANRTFIIAGRNIHHRAMPLVMFSFDLHMAVRADTQHGGRSLREMRRCRTYDEQRQPKPDYRR